MTYLAIDRNGCHVCVPKTTNNLCRKVYLSKEDCIKAEIEGLAIVDFPDEPTAPVVFDLPEEPKKPKIHTLHFVEM